MHWAKADLAHEYIVAANNIHSWTAISPNAGVVYEGRPGRVSITRGDQIRIRLFKIGAVMKCLTALLAAVILLAGVGASDAAVRIAQDPGGRIDTYVGKYQGVRSSGEMVIIDGLCVSACTIVLGTVPHDKICVTSRAKLGFHAAWDPGSKGRKITNPEATQTLYSMYPLEIRRWIDQRGGLTPHMVFLSGRQLSAMYRPCYLDSKASSH
jgi:hypothetical protein